MFLHLQQTHLCYLSILFPLLLLLKLYYLDEDENERIYDQFSHKEKITYILYLYTCIVTYNYGMLPFMISAVMLGERQQQHQAMMKQLPRYGIL